MKKLLSMIIVAALLVTTAAPVFGSTSSESAALQKAIQSARAVIDIPAEASIFEHHSWDDPTSGRIWYLTWRDQDYEISYSVSVDDAGAILNFYAHERRDPGGLGTMSREQGQKVAESFLSRILPENRSDFRLRDVTSNEWRTTYIFAGHMNGFPVSEMMYYVEVDRITEKVFSFSGPGTTNRNDKFQVPANQITEAEAKKAYLESKSVSLVYNGFYNFSEQELVVFPSFTINPGKFIDAESGKAIEGMNVFWPASWGRFMAESGGGMAVADNDALTPSEREAVDNIAGLITRERAVRAATQAVPGLSSSDRATSANLSARFDDRSKFDWYLQFENYGVTIDAANGELVSFFFFGQREERRTGTVTAESAEKTAREFITRVASAKFAQTVLDESRNNNRVRPLSADANTMPYSFTFVREVNGLQFPYNYISVSVDALTGRITQYELKWSDNAKFPELTDTISEEEVFTIFAKEIGFGLLYTRTAEDTMSLVYGFMGFPEFSLNPVTGAMLGSDGEPFRSRSGVTEYDDIAGKWYENTVTILLDSGYFIEGASFNGNAHITQEEFLKYLYSPMQSFFTQSDFYDMLVQNKIITWEEFAPDSLLARQDAAKFAIRFLGLGKAATDGSIFRNPFRDRIAEDYLGYAALVRALGIMQGDSRGNFNGEHSMTRAQAAVVILNTLENR